MSYYTVSALERKLDKLESRLEHKIELPPIPDSLIEFSKQFRVLNKQPFSFDYVDPKHEVFIPDARKYLYDIYTSTSDRIAIVKGRQMEVTEYAVNYVIHNALKHQGCTIIYTSPRQDQVNRFSKRRLRKAIYDNRLLRGFLPEEPSVHEVNIGESVVYLFSAWHDMDALRNIAGDIAILDEAQDIELDALPVLEEALSHSAINKVLIIGTPKDAGSRFEDIWRDSSQKEWDREKEAWFAKQPPDPWEGFHITQLMAPWIPLEKIEYKKRKYVPQKFENEVLGLFFKGAGRPLTVDDMAAVTDSSLMWSTGCDDPRRIIYAGADWGTGTQANTVFLALEVIEEGDITNYKIVYIENISQTALDPIGEVARIAALIDKFRVKRFVADIGFGYVQVNELRKTFGDRVMGCSYLGNVKEPIKYKQTSLGAVLEVDRSYYIDKAIDVVKRKRVTMPGADREKKEWLWGDFVCLYLEAEETTHGRRYRRWQHDSGATDDLFHAFNYALIAYEVDTPYRRASQNVVSFGEERFFVDFGD